MKNKEIAIRVGTTEQVVKNYLRKVYDKLGVADRLELALYCLNNRLPEGNRTTTSPALATASELRKYRFILHLSKNTESVDKDLVS